MLMHGAVKNAANLSDFYTFSFIELNGINTYMYKHLIFAHTYWIGSPVKQGP